MMMSPHFLSGNVFHSTWTGEIALLRGQRDTVPVRLSDWYRETRLLSVVRLMMRSRLVVTDPDNFPEARFWPTSELPTIHERRIGIFGCVSHQLSAFVRSIGFKDCPSY